MRLNAELERRAAELAAANEAIRRGEDRAKFLARASHELAGSLELDDTLQSLVSLPVGPLADARAIELGSDLAVHPVVRAIARNGAAPAVQRSSHAGSRDAWVCLPALEMDRPQRGPLPRSLVELLRVRFRPHPGKPGGRRGMEQPGMASESRGSPGSPGARRPGDGGSPGVPAAAADQSGTGPTRSASISSSIVQPDRHSGDAAGRRW